MSTCDSWLIVFLSQTQGHLHWLFASGPCVRTDSRSFLHHLWLQDWLLLSSHSLRSGEGQQSRVGSKLHLVQPVLSLLSFLLQSGNADVYDTLQKCTFFQKMMQLTFVVNSNGGLYHINFIKTFAFMILRKSKSNSNKCL